MAPLRLTRLGLSGFAVLQYYCRSGKKTTLSLIHEKPPSSPTRLISTNNKKSYQSSHLSLGSRPDDRPPPPLPPPPFPSSPSNAAASRTSEMVQSPMYAAHTHVVPKLHKAVATIQRLLFPAQYHVKALPRALAPGTQLIRHEKPALAERIPRGAWDSHMHVVDPDNYDLVPEAIYRPSSFTLDQAMEFEKSVGISNIVLVQPSIYGNDNTCLLDALEALGTRRARGVVSFDPATTSQSELRAWHRLGVRGVRLNIQSIGRTVTRQQLETLLRQYADAVRPLNWVVQVYVPLHLVELLEPIVPQLNVRFCIDHLGHPCLQDSTPHNPYDLPGFASLARLLEEGHTYVKLSAPYRISRRDDLSDLEPIAREILRLRGTSRVVFATDWPHTRFEGLDIRPWMETVLDWCGNDDYLKERLFRRNAEDLWDVMST